MKRSIIALLALLLGAAGTALATPARTSIYGTILGAEHGNPNVLEVQTWHSGIGRIDVLVSGARVNSNGQPLARGTFAGFYGYFTNGRRDFRAEQVTLSSSPSSYPRQYRTVGSELEGTIQSVQPGRILLDTPTNGRVWVRTPERGLYAGERVQAWGTYDAWTGSMTSRHITVISR